VTAAAAQRAARAILAESRFHQPGAPRPLHGALVAIGKFLEAPLSGIERLADDLATVSPGGIAGVWVAFALALAAITVALACRRARARLRGARQAQDDPGGAERAADLDRAASGAEREGRLEDAVRLRFRAGLAALSERAAIPSARTTPTREVARRLRSARFDALAERFDEIAYGHDSATAADVEHARRDWPEILDAGARR
jgi:hypothetical protein